mmetsp:Transcript_13203/g.40744  ORF Transcript_13203/g.40744 Transcript_13203/m.40744 type:complete len:346 (-) Transcript_13203:37-1074(-)
MTEKTSSGRRGPPRFTCLLVCGGDWSRAVLSSAGSGAAAAGKRKSNKGCSPKKASSRRCARPLATSARSTTNEYRLSERHFVRTPAICTRPEAEPPSLQPRVAQLSGATDESRGARTNPTGRIGAPRVARLGARRERRAARRSRRQRGARSINCDALEKVGRHASPRDPKEVCDIPRRCARHLSRAAASVQSDVGRVWLLLAAATTHRLSEIRARDQRDSSPHRGTASIARSAHLHRIRPHRDDPRRTRRSNATRAAFRRARHEADERAVDPSSQRWRRHPRRRRRRRARRPRSRSRSPRTSSSRSRPRARRRSAATRPTAATSSRAASTRGRGRRPRPRDCTPA